jgi:hypothetical protein
MVGEGACCENSRAEHRKGRRGVNLTACDVLFHYHATPVATLC